MRIFPFSITLLACLLSSTIHAGNNLRIEKQVQDNQELAGAGSITFNLYATRTDPVPLISQSFDAGEWLKKTQAEHTMVSAELRDMPSMQDTTGLWVELEINGQPVGQREPLAAGATGITFATGNPLNMSGNAIRDVADPTLAQDAATKAYVDDVAIATGSGDITAITLFSYSGLTGGGTSGNIHLGTDSNILQRRVTGTCDAGSSIKEIAPSGIVYCENDDVGYSMAGSGLRGSGSMISVNNSIVARKDAAAGNQAFDTSTLYLDYTNNRVGINDTTPLTTLDVNGTTSASRYVYRTPRAYSQYISAIKFNFQPYETYDGSERFEYNYYSGSITPYAHGTHSHLIAGIQLPQGANVSRLTCYYSDNSEIEDIKSITASLTSRRFLESNRATLGSIHTTTTGNNPDIVQNADISISGPGDPIDNRHFMYLLEMELRLTENTSSENFFRYALINFYGCKIDYELAEVAP